jgi:hypothetical protein
MEKVAMNNSWKLSILGAVALASSVAVMVAGCTVTSTTTTDDGGTTGDSSTGDGGTTDTGTADAGGDGEGGTCAATAVCPIIGSSTGVTFDNCGACDTCEAMNCCTAVTNCFANVGGMQSDCSHLFDCLVACVTADGGDTCAQACKAAYTDDAGMNPTFDLLTAADNCQSTSCNAQCP